MLELLPLDQLEGRFRFARGRWLLAEADLAQIHGVTTERLRRCLRPFEPLPGEFCFPFDELELRVFALRVGRDGRPPLAFTEQGALAAGCLLGTPAAIAQSIRVARVFTQLRADGLVHEAGNAIDETVLIAAAPLVPSIHSRTHPLPPLDRTPVRAGRQPSLTPTLEPVSVR